MANAFRGFAIDPICRLWVVGSEVPLCVVNIILLHGILVGHGVVVVGHGCHCPESQLNDNKR